jgi:hypothetical protein
VFLFVWLTLAVFVAASIAIFVASDALSFGVFSSGNPSLALEAGDCVDIPTADSELVISSHQIVSCAEPHVAEYAGSALLSYQDGAPYPGDQVVIQAAGELCLDLFAAHVGSTVDQRADLDVAVVSPSPDTWQRANDREIGCFVVSADGSLLDRPVGAA